MHSDLFTRRLIRAALALSVLFVFCLLPSLPGHDYDNWCWRAWTTHTMAHGLTNAYGSGTDYPPLLHYVLWVLGKLMGDAETVALYYWTLRLFTLMVEFFGVYTVWRWAGRPGMWAALALFSLLNIGSSYNTIIWGQVDAILTTLVLLAFYLAYTGKRIASSIAMTAALLFKLQAVVFVPVWGVVVLAGVARTRRWKEIPLMLIAITAAALLIVLPFILTEESRVLLSKAIFGSVDRYPSISKNASNFWQLVAHDRTSETDAQPWLAWLTYKTAGLAMFVIASAVAMWPLLRYAVRQFSGDGEAPFSREKLWLSIAIIALNFFFWPTQIHERYSHPALFFLLAYALTTRDWLPYVLFSLAYFLNLEVVMRTLHLKNYGTFLFDMRLGATLFGVLLFYLYARLYGWQGFLPPSRERNSETAIVAAAAR